MEQTLADSIIRGMGITTGVIAAILIAVASLLATLAVWYTLKYIIVAVKDKRENKGRWTGKLPIIATIIIYCISMTYITRTHLIRNMKDLIFIMLILITLPIIVDYMVKLKKGGTK